ncbi:carbohydrate deacetylase [Clostridium sp. YIM B02506]|uniref:carbohydrate deacetylase n=1 Tax=Clostridium sp. YIM B02506 TaxID=2910680 RepID=UPI001EEF51AC|nr:carbohydrate deacetylase [Clostridium sp. YIM B02506]
MRLIINADDFGLTLGISKGIIEGLKNGIITDTSAMVNSKYFEESLDLAKAAGIKSMGVHLNITALRPISKSQYVKTIIDSEGNFYKNPSLIPKGYSYEEIERELRAQIEKFLNTGLVLDHLDVHHGFNAMEEKLFTLVMNLAKEYKVPLRKNTEEFKELVDKAVKRPDYFIKDFYGDNVTIEKLKENLLKYREFEGTLEMMTHPGFVDEEIMKISSYNIHREEELKVLTSSEIKDFINKSNINLVNYKSL